MEDIFSLLGSNQPRPKPTIKQRIIYGMSLVGFFLVTFVSTFAVMRYLPMWLSVPMFSVLPALIMLLSYKCIMLFLENQKLKMQIKKLEQPYDNNQL